MEIVDYIKKTTGLNVVSRNLPDEVIKGLPLYQSIGTYQELYIENRRVILDIRKSFQGITPDRLAKQKNCWKSIFLLPLFLF
ncbi:MAG: hypothetical protein IPN18_12150 [Ignavibacteriales bacterium]|nr:hypothetical protein [Ignavibacteriales bacterium]